MEALLLFPAIALVTILPLAIVNGIVWYKQKKRYGSIPSYSWVISALTVAAGVFIFIFGLSSAGHQAGWAGGLLIGGIMAFTAVMALIIYAFLWAIYTIFISTVRSKAGLVFAMGFLACLTGLDIATGAIRDTLSLFVFGSSKEIDFSGQIIDQHGNGVQGIKIGLTIDLANRIKPITVTSGDNGTFRISERGDSFHFNEIHKDGYEFRIPYEKFTLGDYPRPQHERNAAGHTRSTPFQIHAWKSKPAPLIHDEGRYSFKRDDSAYSISLTSGDKYHQGGLNDLQFRFSGDQGSIYEGDWKLVITAPNGGLAESNDLFMNLAPEDGYLQTIVIEQKKGTPGYKNKLTKSFYIRSRSGSLYGRLELEIDPFYNEYSVIRLKSWLNPNSDRNLTYDKTIELQGFEDSYFEDGKAALERGEFDKARKLLLLRADNGDKRAMLLLGEMCFNGRGVSKDSRKAFEWFQKVIARSDRRLRYMDGFNGKEWSVADFFLGIMYRDGNGVEQNREKAITLLTRLADGGDPQSSFELGELYSRSKKISDTILAHCFYKRAEHMTEYFKNDALANASRIKYSNLATKLSDEEAKLSDSLELCRPSEAFAAYVKAD